MCSRISKKNYTEIRSTEDNILPIGEIQTDRSAEVNVRLDGLHHSLVARVPDSQRLIVGCADDKLAARMEDDAPHPVVVSDEGEEAHPGADVPHAYHFVSGAGREERSLVRALVVRAGRRVD